MFPSAICLNIAFTRESINLHFSFAENDGCALMRKALDNLMGILSFF